MANNNKFPEFDTADVNLDEAFEIADCDTVVRSLIKMSERGEFEQFDLSLVNVETPVKLRCSGYAIVDRHGITRLYISYSHVGDGDNNMYTAYIVSNDDGVGLLVPEHDENMMSIVRDVMNATIDMSDAVNADGASAPQKSSKASKVVMIIGCIILFPVWLLWQFVKALLSLFNIGFGDSSTVRAFKRGYSGADERRECKFTNEMGCEETLYTYDGKTYYNYDGSYAGVSDDNGKTLSR